MTLIPRSGIRTNPRDTHWLKPLLLDLNSVRMRRLSTWQSDQPLILANRATQPLYTRRWSVVFVNIERQNKHGQARPPPVRSLNLRTLKNL